VIRYNLEIMVALLIGQDVRNLLLFLLLSLPCDFGQKFYRNVNGCRTYPRTLRPGHFPRRTVPPRTFPPPFSASLGHSPHMSTCLVRFLEVWWKSKHEWSGLVMNVSVSTADHMKKESLRSKTLSMSWRLWSWVAVDIKVYMCYATGSRLPHLTVTSASSVTRVAESTASVDQTTVNWRHNTYYYNTLLLIQWVDTRFCG